MALATAQGFALWAAYRTSIRGWALAMQAQDEEAMAQKQHLDNLRRKDSLRGAETTEISVRLGNYSASHFEGSAQIRRGITAFRATGAALLVPYLCTVGRTRLLLGFAFGDPG